MRPKHMLLLGLGVVSFLMGALGQYFYPGAQFPPSNLWLTPVGILLIFWWYRIDAAEHSYKRSPWLNISVIAIAIVALPYYFFRSRGAKHGFVAVGLFVLALIASSLLSTAGIYATYQGLQS